MHSCEAGGRGRRALRSNAFTPVSACRAEVPVGRAGTKNASRSRTRTTEDVTDVAGSSGSKVCFQPIKSRCVIFVSSQNHITVFSESRNVIIPF